MKNCKSCRTEIDDKAIKCPSCQTDQRNWFVKHKILTVILALILIGIISSSGNKKSSTYETPKVSTTTSENTPMPTRSAGKVEVKSERKKMDIGYTQIVGEVVNNTSISVDYVKVTATFYDAEGKVISTGDTFAGDTTSTPLEPDKTTPFEVSSYPDKINAISYKLDVTWR